jgi:hypothetical protein
MAPVHLRVPPGFPAAPGGLGWRMGLACCLVLALIIAGVRIGSEGGVGHASAMRLPGSVSSRGPNFRRSWRILHSYVVAYNNHDAPGVLKTLAARFRYSDCDYARHILHVITSRSEMRRWLRGRFRDHDRFNRAHVVLDGPQGDPPNDPRTNGIDVRRTSDSLRAIGWSPHILSFKIFLNNRGTGMEDVASSDKYDCSGTRPNIPAP